VIATKKHKKHKLEAINKNQSGASLLFTYSALCPFCLFVAIPDSIPAKRIEATAQPHPWVRLVAILRLTAAEKVPGIELKLIPSSVLMLYLGNLFLHR
jgi:hypothetical protein